MAPRFADDSGITLQLPGWHIPFLTTSGTSKQGNKGWIGVNCDINPELIFNFPRRVKMSIVPFVIFGIVVVAAIIIWIDDAAIHRVTHHDDLMHGH